MRLRLRIERNALPPTQALWPVKDTKSTTAQLLQAVNEIFPLEADDWGLEDYTVSVCGYECLHYHKLSDVCKDEDEVLITPLQYVDIRSRTMTGRAQIAEDGKHLVDGVPFGRPQLKQPVRPQIRIPPRKKRKFSLLENGDGGDGGDGREEDGPLMLTENGEELDEEEDDEEDDDDYEADASTSDGSSSPDSQDTSSDSSDEDTSESEVDSSSDSESEDGESWDGIPNSEPSTPAKKLERSGAKSVVNAVEQPTEAPLRPKQKRQSEDTQMLDNEQSHEPKQRRLPADDAPAEPGHEPSVPQTVGVPFEGKDETKRRNARRRDTKKLKYLISIGALPQGATLESLERWQQSSSGSLDNRMDVDGANDKPTVQSDEIAENSRLDPYSVLDSPEFARKREKLISDIATGGVDVTRPKQPTQPKKKRKTKTSDITAGVDVTPKPDEDDEPPSEEESSRLPPHPLYPALTSLRRNENAQSITDKATAMISPSTTPRSKLDIAGSQRLIFGSLGVRGPKTLEEKDQLQKKLAQRAIKNVASVNQVSTLEVNGGTPASAGEDMQGEVMNVAQEDEEDTSWMSKIKLTAVECCDEGVTLSAPPFPFYQRWDPQYKKKKGKQRVNGMYMEGGGVKRKRGGRGMEYFETYDKYNVNGDGDALEYDDALVEEDDEYWEDGALLNGGYEDDEEISEDGSVEGDSGGMDDGFPALPTNVDELPTLNKQDAREGDFITFTELACDESTGWEPKEATRTAKILSIRDTDKSDTLAAADVQIQVRDQRSKVFDQDGNRVYSKFDMPDTDMEEDFVRGVSWQELGEVRLVARPEEIEADGI